MHVSTEQTLCLCMYVRVHRVCIGQPCTCFECQRFNIDRRSLRPVYSGFGGVPGNVSDVKNSLCLIGTPLSQTSRLFTIEASQSVFKKC